MAGDDLENVTFLSEVGTGGAEMSLDSWTNTVPEQTEDVLARWRFPLVVVGLVMGLGAMAGFLRHGHISFHGMTGVISKIQYPCISSGGCGMFNSQVQADSKLAFKGKCVGVDPHNVRNGGIVQLRPCEEQGNHNNWYFDGYGGPGKLHIQADRSLCLDVKDHSFHNGQVLQLWKCEDWNDDQKLSIHKSDHDYRLQWHNHPHYYVDVKDGSNDLWNQVQIWKRGPNQHFYDD